MAVSRDFIVEIIERIYPTANTGIGSRLDVELIQPIVDLFDGFDPDDIDEFLTTRIQEYDSSIVTSAGTANYDIMISSIRSILEPIWWQIKTIKQWQSLDNYASMPTEEMDALVANYFVNRIQGAKARGTVRLYFGSPQTVIFNKFVRFTTRSGLGFIPATESIIQADVMALNQEGGQYYTDLLIEAESRGSNYNILADQIVGIENLQVAYIRVVNTAAFRGGSDRETNSDLYIRTRDAITVRTLDTKKGIRYKFRSEFPRVTDIEVVGAGDPDMDRDLEAYGYTTTNTITQVVSGGVPITVGTTSVTGANFIHVLGHVDVYAYTSDLSEGYLDVQNVNPSQTIRMSKLPPYQVNMPVVRVKTVERLDPVYLTQTGQTIPYKHPIDARALRDFYFGTDENTLDRALGTVRLFFENPTSMTVDTSSVLTAENGQTFRPIRTQSITATGMSLNTGQTITETAMETNIVYNQDITYYYFDISVKSDTAGDSNALLSDNDYLSITNYTSEGWSLTTNDQNLAFSTEETVILSFTATFNDGIAMSGEAVRITYEYAPSVTEMQTFAGSEDERVVTSDLLVKHFQPAYVDLAVSYEGNITEDDVELYIRNFVNEIAQGVYFEVADMVAMLYEYGATRVILPLEVFVLILDKDRTYSAVRFQDRYRTEKRTHFVARNIDVRKLA